MLTTFSANSCISKTSPLLRRRGGQPSNRNALKHGLYAAKKPTPLATLLKPLLLENLGLAMEPAAYDQAILALRQHTLQLAMGAKESAIDLRPLLACMHPIEHSVRALERLSLASYRQSSSSFNLKIASAYPLELIRWGFRYAGITRDANLTCLSQYSFPEKKRKKAPEFDCLPEAFFPRHFGTSSNFPFPRPSPVIYFGSSAPLSKWEMRPFGEGTGVGSKRSPSRRPASLIGCHLLEIRPPRPLEGSASRFAAHAHLPPLLSPPVPKRSSGHPLFRSV